MYPKWNQQSEISHFLGDALGSARRGQLTDSTGAVTYAAVYDPYGAVTQTSGAGQTAYGFTGEQQDGDLVYLRARYLNVSDGRFLSKDTWEGNFNLPQSLNRWNYVEANPINQIDPSGNIPTSQEVLMGKQVYSCNCGWIDFGHVGTRLALSIINLLNKEKNIAASPEIRGDAFAITPSVSISIWKKYDQKVSFTAVVKTGLSEQVKSSVALGIFRSIEEKVEFTQGDAGMWFTSFSFEDLTSDEIGFYLAREFKKEVNPATDDKAWNYLAEKCDFPQNRQEAINRSVKAYNSMNIDSLWGDPFTRLIIDTPYVYSWASPLLCKLNGLCDDKPHQWPVEFTSIKPVSPFRNQFWWFYDGMLDGRLVSPASEFSPIYRQSH